MKATDVLTLLLRLEWSGDPREYVCPSCAGSRMHGHVSGCDLARVMAEAQLAASVEA